MKKIQANNDKNAYAMVDDDVYEIIQKIQLKFSVDKVGYFYGITRIKLPCMTKTKRLYLHQLVWMLKTGKEPELTVDHIDMNKSNNQFKNLRLATVKQQMHNQRKRKNNTSGLIGVCKYHQVGSNGKEYVSWRAFIMRPDGKRESKKFPYTDAGKSAAGKWYDSKAREYRGEFAGELNFPDE